MQFRKMSAVLVLVLAVSPAFGQSNYVKYKSMLPALADVVAKSAESTVRIRCGDKDAALGTVVGTDGWIVTKYSEIKGDPICRLKDGREFPAKIFGVQDQYDLALLKIDARNLPVAEWRDSKDDGVGSWVASPGVGREPLALGVVSVLSRKIDPRSERRTSPNPNGGFLGVNMENVKDGVRIFAVTKDTPAAKCGLKPGDVVKSIDGKPTPDMDAMAEILGNHHPHDKVTIQFVRDSKSMSVTAELAKRDMNQDRGLFQNTMGGAQLSNRRTGFPVILQHDTILKPSDCGGPLVDLDGRVIGVNIARKGRVESEAIPAEIVQTLVVDLEAGKYPVPTPTVAEIFGPRIFEAETKLRDLQDEKSAVEKRIKEAEEARRKQEQKIKEDNELLRKQAQKIKDAEEALRSIQERADQAKKAEEAKKTDKK